VASADWFAVVSQPAFLLCEIVAFQREREGPLLVKELCENSTVRSDALIFMVPPPFLEGEYSEMRIGIDSRNTPYVS
jgi:hypothetical protein